MDRNVTLKEALQCWREEHGAQESATGRHIPTAELYDALAGNPGKTMTEDDLDHLAACPTCSAAARELMISLAEFGKKTIAQPPRPETFLHTLLGKIRELPQTLSWPWQLAIPSAALAGIAFIVFGLFTVADLNEQLTLSYQGVMAQHGPEAREMLLAFPPVFPEESTALGFGASAPSPAEQAYGAGVWVGKTEISGAVSSPLPPSLSSATVASWPDSQWRGFYAFGRWSTLLWMLSGTDRPVPDWQPYLRMLTGIRDELTSRSASEPAAAQALDAIKGIRELLEKVSSQDDTSSREALRREMVNTMVRMSSP